MKNYEAGLSPREFARHIKGCARNRRESQKKIYNSFYNHGMVICDSDAGGYNEAVEILNEGFLKIFKQVRDHSPACAIEMTSFLHWLRATMVHTAMNHHKRNNKRHVVVELNNEAYYCHNLIEDKFENH